MKKIVFHSLIMILMLILVSTVNIYGQDLSLTIKLDKENFNKGEPVKCSMTLTNLSSKDIVINHRFLVNRPDGPHEISLQIIDPSLKPVPLSSKINASYTSNLYKVLQPGKSETSTYIITEDYELMDSGKYSVIAYYENKNDAPASLKLSTSWKGTLISNKVNFTIH